jgi:RNA-directed DNA polymerase
VDALYAKSSRAEGLAPAWRLVRANRGSPGVEGLSCEAREGGRGRETCLGPLAPDRKDHTSRAQPGRRVLIPKADGSVRPRGIPTIRDRVAQRAVQLRREPLFAADFWAPSDGLRPRKSAHAAVDDSAPALWAGDPQVRDAALSHYVASLPPAKRRAVGAERIGEGSRRPLRTLGRKAPGSGEAEKGGGKTVGGGKATRPGPPQGGGISPRLANGSLPLRERIGQRPPLNDKRHAPRGRDAADFVVRGRREGQEPRQGVGRVRERLGLSLTEVKTPRGDAPEASCNFWGVAIRRSRGLRPGQPSPPGGPADKGLRKLKTQLTALTGRELPALPCAKRGEKVNRRLRGWVNSFP